MISKFTKFIPTTLHTFKSKAKSASLTNPWSGNVIYAPSTLSEDILDNYTIPPYQRTFTNKRHNRIHNRITEDIPIEPEYPNNPTTKSRKLVSKTSRLDYRIHHFF